MSMPIGEKSKQRIQKFVEQFARTKKEVRDIVGLLYKKEIRKRIEYMKAPKSIKEIMKGILK